MLQRENRLENSCSHCPTDDVGNKYVDLEWFETIECAICLTEDVPSNRWFSLLICVADHDPFCHQ